jgi:hypothetical protein
VNTPKSQKTERILQYLFSRDAILRERALLSVAPHERQRVRELVTLRHDAELLLQAMLDDLGSTSAKLRDDFNSQFNRRAAIRALAATVDGIIFTFKQFALVSARLTGAQLDADETEFLREQQASPTQRKARLPSFRDNFKRTFKLFAKVHHASCSTDFGQAGFEALCETFELRNRVTHPKSFTTFCVSDKETNRAGVAIDWLGRELNRLLDASEDALGKR